MKWVYDNLGGGHRGEYDWECSSCKKSDWFARYTDPNKQKIPCPHCGKKPDGT